MFSIEDLISDVKTDPTFSSLLISVVEVDEDVKEMMYALRGDTTEARVIDGVEFRRIDKTLIVFVVGCQDGKDVLTRFRSVL